MRYSKRVAITGCLIGLLGVVLSGVGEAGRGDLLVLGGFMVLAASAVCRSIEDTMSRSND